jgi:hypothetical protein
MRNIAELNMLLRVQVELPSSLKLVTDEFREGWNFVRSLDARRLEKKVHTSGWSFFKVADACLRSGVGETSQQAIASALKLALRRVSEHLNAAEVEHIELTRYPWFFLARVGVCPYRIQQNALVPVLDEVAPLLPLTPRHKLLSPNADALYPHFGSTMPQLKQMLTSTRGSEARVQ